MRKKVSILGSTGSIGVNSLNVIKRHPGRFEIVALAAGSNVSLLAEQINVFKPKFVSVKDDGSAKKLKEYLKAPIEVLVGDEGAVTVARSGGSDIVVSSMVGAVGLRPTYEAVKAGKTVALANKETLVAAGELMIKKAKETGVMFLPIDSEHSAVFQSMQGNKSTQVRKIILTASGGPFREYEGDLSKVSVSAALNHPNWSMGAKITIDSATMMNKGLEIIEAHWLFGLPENKIEVLIHPQSIIHSMVEYCDSSMMAQMGRPDMREAISYALAFPDRIESGVLPVDWAELKELTFFRPNHKKFPLMGLAREAIKSGGSVPAVMNAANEIAVEAFLEKKIGFLDIYKVIFNVVESHERCDIKDIEDVFAVDREGRNLASGEVRKLAAHN